MKKKPKEKQRIGMHRLLSLLLVFTMIFCMMPGMAWADPLDVDQGTAATVYVTISNKGEIVKKDNSDEYIAQVPVTLTGKESYTIDDALKAFHDQYYVGGAAAGYQSSETMITKLWGIAGNGYGYGYQLNSGKTQSSLGQTVSDGDYLDAYIISSADEQYGVFQERTYRAATNTSVALRLRSIASYDESGAPVYSDADDKTYVKGLTIRINGTETEATVGAYGFVTLTFDKAGTYVVSTAASTTISAPVCVVTITEKPTLSDVKVYTDKAHTKILEMTPAFSGGTNEYTVTAPDYSSKLYVTAEGGDNFDGKAIYCSYKASWGSESYTPLGGDVSYRNGNYFNVVVYDETNSPSDYDNKYVFNVKTYATLKNLVIDGTVNQSFDAGTVDGYHAYVDSTQDGVDITATGYYNDYSVTIAGKEAVNGTAYHLTFDWNDEGKMEVPVVVSGGETSTTYRITLEKEPLNDVPYVITQPTGGDYIVGDTAAAMTLHASANGEMAYQWYKNSVNSTEGNGAERIDGATETSYLPKTDYVETAYYFCKITNTETQGVAYTDVVKVVVDPDPTPVAELKTTGSSLSTDDGYPYSAASGYAYDLNETTTTLSVEATSAAEGTLTYQWYQNTGFADIMVSGATDAVYTPSSTAATAKGIFYSCKVSVEFKGKTYSSFSDKVYVYVRGTEAATPIFRSQPAGGDYVCGDTPKKLSFFGSAPDGGDLSYQWYRNSTESTEGGTAIEGATMREYTPPTQNEAGTVYYYCVLTNTFQKFTASATSDVVTLTFVSALDAAKAAWEGSGTKDDPFQLDSADDFKQLRTFVDTNGFSFENVYFKMTADITLPSNWSDGIGGGTTAGNGMNLKPFSGNLDGDGHTLTYSRNCKALFDYVREASVQNLKIQGEYIQSYALVNNYVVDYGSDGDYVLGTGGSQVPGCPDTIDIKNVTILSGTNLKNGGFIGGYASGANVVNISSCVVESGVKIGVKADGTSAGLSAVGSFAGEFNGMIINCTSAATVYGVDYVGGIVGAKGQTAGSYDVSNCSFTGEIVATGEFVGGIAGGGYKGSQWGVGSAPNTFCARIENCYVTGTVTGADKVGGIFGGEEGVTQCWLNGAGYVRNNSFSGVVSATNENGCSGGIIGYMNSLNKNTNVSNNYYLESSAEKGIGSVQYIDTSCSDHETASGATYFDTSIAFDGQRLPDGVTKEDLNRTDDPLGTDADKLAKAMTAEQFSGGTVVGLLNAGEGSFGNWKQGENCPVFEGSAIAYKLEVSGAYKKDYVIGESLDLSDAVFMATWTDGEMTTVDLEDIVISGFDSTTRGQKTVKLSYGAASAEIVVVVLKNTELNPTGTITVSFRLLGDTDHGDNGEVHTLSGNNLVTWMQKSFTVNENSTVEDILKLAEAENDALTFNGEWSGKYGSTYIKGVTYNGVYLEEFTNGTNSGWMYTVNGVHPGVGVSAYYLENGDSIIFHYTDDYTKEQGSEAWGNQPYDPNADLPEDAPTVTLTDETGATITTGGKVSYDSKTATLTITPAAGYEIKDVKVNGVSKGAVTELKGLTKNDKVAVVFAKIAEEDPETTVDTARIIKGVQATTIKLKTVDVKKGYIKVGWTKSKGYKVDGYQVFRSVKRYSGYTTKPFFTKKTSKITSTYKNTKSLKSGTRYYYKVRGYRIIDGQKYYTQWSNKAWWIAK